MSIIQELTNYFTAGKAAIDLFKGIRDELPQTDKSKQLREQIEKAEAAFQTSQAELAKGLGHQICRCTFPPQIMLWDREQRRDVCQQCGDVHPPDRPQPERTQGRLASSRGGRGR
jgi:hypothetical protein